MELSRFYHRKGRRPSFAALSDGHYALGKFGFCETAEVMQQRVRIESPLTEAFQTVPAGTHR
jgi:hypothetical protein